MDLLEIYGLGSAYKSAPAKPMGIIDEVPAVLEEEEERPSFQTILDAAMGMVEETNTLQNEASNEAIRFELGLADNTHDLMIAEQKASVALQYTVAVRDRFIEAYNQIMQMQI